MAERAKCCVGTCGTVAMRPPMKFCAYHWAFVPQRVRDIIHREYRIGQDGDVTLAGNGWLRAFTAAIECAVKVETVLASDESESAKELKKNIAETEAVISAMATAEATDGGAQVVLKRSLSKLKRLNNELNEQKQARLL